jgi:hypothetical protein
LTAAGLPLGGETGILNGFRGKLNCMRWRAFEAIVSKHDESVDQSLRAMMLQFNLVSYELLD